MVTVGSDEGISVFALNQDRYTADMTVVLPASALGTEYYIVAPQGISFLSQFAVINEFDTNEVTVTVSGMLDFNGTTYSDKQNFSFTLTSNQVIQFQSTTELTGTRIVSSEPVAVISGNVCLNYQGDTACDVVLTELYPVNSWGTAFVVFPLLLNKDLKDRITILSAEPNNTVYITTENTTTQNLVLQEGSFTVLELTGPMSINSTKPVMLTYLFTGGRNFNFSSFNIADPFLSNIVPSSSYSDTYTFITIANYENYIMVVAHQSDLTGFSLDGQPLETFSPEETQAFGFSAKLVYLGIAGGHHVITHESATFGIYVFGLGYYVAFGYTIRNDLLLSGKNIIGNLKSTGITTSSISVSWSAPNGSAIGYRVEAIGNPSKNLTVSTAFAEITGLIPGSKYTLRVIALAADNVTEVDAVTITRFTKPDIVVNLTAENITTTSIALSWSAPNGNAIGYRVEAIGNPSKNLTVNTLFTEITGLVPGSNYTLRIIALAADNVTEGDAVTISRFTKPDIVVNLTAENITTTSIALSWSAPNGNAIGYRVEAIGNPSKNLTVNTLFTEITGLVPGSNYTLRIIALAADNVTEGDAVTITIFTKPDIAPNLTASNITTTSIALSWSAPNGNAIGYRVEAIGNPSKNLTVNTLFTEITGLVPGSNYTLRIIALAADNVTEGDAEAISRFTKPDIVVNLTAENITTTSIALSWSAPNGNAIGYRVEAIGNPSKNLTVNTLFTEITGLVPGSNYTLRIIALAADNVTEGDAETISRFTKPDIVVNLTAENITTTSIALSWSAPNGNAIGYRVEAIGNPSKNLTVNTLFTEITGLVPGSNYTLRIIALAADNVTEGDAVTITIFTKPDIVVNLTAENITTTSIALSWSAPNGNAIGYRVEAIGNPSKNLTVNTLFTEITGLVPGSNYTLRIIALAADNVTEGDAVTITIFTKPDVAPNLTASNITTTSIALSWSAPNGNAIGYRVEAIGNPSKNLTVNTLFTEITGLVPGSNYTLRIIALAADNVTEGDAETISRFTKPDIAVNLTAENITTTSIALSWSAPNGNAIGYRVEAIGNPSKNLTVNTLFTEITGLVPGSNYTLQIIALAADNVTEGDAVTISRFTKPDIVVNLTAENITTTSIALSWSAPNGNAIGYRVEAIGNPSKNLTVNTLFTEITGLVPGSNYTLRIIALAADNVTEGDAVTITIFTKPDIAPNLTASNITTTSIALSWSAPNGNAIGYRVEAIGNPSKNLTVNTLFTEITGLVPGSNYTLRIIALAADNVTEGEAEAISRFTKPDIAVNLTAENITTTSIALSWSAPNGNAIGYRVEAIGNPSNNLTVNTLFTEITGLVPGSNYTLRIIALAADNVTEGDAVTISRFTKPDIAVNLTAENITTTSIALSWSAPNGNAIGYRVEAIGNPSKNLTVNTLFTEITGLVPGSNYTLRIIALAADNVTEGDAVTISRFTKPDIAVNLTAENITTTSIALSWSAPNGNAIGYRVEAIGNPSKNLTVNTLFTEITGLVPGSNYTLRIIALAADNVTEGDAVTISRFTKPDIVVNLTAENITTTSIALSWSAPNGNAIGYRVEAIGNPSKNLTVNTLFTEITGLVPGSNYTLRIIALAADNVTEGDAVTITIFTKPDVAPNLTASNITTTSIALSWSAPNGNAIGYRVEAIGNPSKNLTVNTLFTEITGLVPGSNYTLRIIALAADNVTEGHAVTITIFTKPDIAVNLTAENITTTSIALSWSAPNGNAIGYRVEAIGNPSNNLTVNTLFTEITGLVPGSNYTLRIIALAADNVTEGDAVTISRFTKPDIAVNLTAENITTTSIALSWSAPNGNAIGYRVEAIGNPSKNLTVNTLFTEITGLVPGSNYTLRIIALAADNVTEGDAVTITIFTKPDIAPNLTASNITTTSIALSWSVPNGNAIGYRVEAIGNPSKNLTVNTLFTEITGLVPGSNYTLRIIALAADNVTEGDAVTISRFTKPDIAVNLTAENITTTSIALSWSAPNGNAIGYRVEAIGNPSNNLTVNTLFTEITGLVPGSNYTLRIIALAADNVTEGDAVTITIFTKPDIAPNLTASNITTTSIALSWSVPNGNAIGYRVEAIGNPSKNLTVNTLFTEITGLVPGSNYTLRIIALAADNVTEGDAVTISRFTKPDIAVNLTAENITTTSIALSWSAPNGNAIGYRVEAIGNPSKNLTVNTLFTEITGLVPGSNYTLRIIALAADNVTEGDAVTITIFTKPEIAVNLTAGNITTTSIALSWSAPNGNAIGYRVEAIGNPSKNLTVNTLFTEITGLLPGSNYTLRIIALAADNVTEGDAVTISRFTKPDSVTNLTAKTITRTSITLSWSAPPGYAHEYMVEAIGTPSKTVTVDTLFANITGLLPLSNYTLRVIAVAADRLTGGDAVAIVTFTSGLDATLRMQLSVSVSAKKEEKELESMILPEIKKYIEQYLADNRFHLTWKGLRRKNP
ncbi:fibronectin-like [Huso huso]|uniref:Fibronectin-like n=1 Tax=Huso huso TaxID=61971 RepID=A0ABR0ZGF1_HUSHU